MMEGGLVDTRSLALAPTRRMLAVTESLLRLDETMLAVVGSVLRAIT
jgi:hypothetical protein